MCYLLIKTNVFNVVFLSFNDKNKISGKFVKILLIFRTLIVQLPITNQIH